MLEQLSSLKKLAKRYLVASHSADEPSTAAPTSAVNALRSLFSGQPRLKTEALLAFALCSIVWIRSMPLVGEFAIDDAYITFSYSKNLALGNGPVYGNGLRVEGYSNFLWVLLTSIGELTGSGAMAAARAFSHLFFGLTLLSTWLLTRRLGGGLAALLVTLLLAVNSDFHRAIQSGLETVAFAAFLSAGLLHYSLESAQKRRFSLLWFSAAALTRIDGFVPLGILVGLEGLAWLRAPSLSQLRRLSIWLLIGSLPVALYWIWRANYYGLAFPLPYYAKASSGIDASEAGANYLWTGVRETGLWVLMLFAAYGLAGRKLHKLLPLCGFIVILGGYVAYVGGDWMPLNRMLLPLVSPLLVVGGAGFHRAFQQTSLTMTLTTRTAAILLSLFVGAHLSQAWILSNAEKAKIGEARGITSHTQGLLAAAPYLRAMLRNPGDKLVTDYGGVFAYGSNASVIEMWGLANREIALRGNHDGIRAEYGKTCVPCYAEFQPDYFHATVPLLKQANSIRSMSQMISSVFQGRAIDKFLGFRKNYVVGRVTDPNTGGVFWFLEKKRPGIRIERRKSGHFDIDYPFSRSRRPPRILPGRSRPRSTSPPAK